MLRLLFLTLFALALKGPANAQKFSGQVYILAESFFADKCEVLIEYDNCSTDLFFLTEKTFAMVNRCLYNHTYYFGNYIKKKNKLHFTFKQVMVREIYDEVHDKKKYEKKKIKIEPIEFNVTVCDVGKVTLEHTPIKDYKYGSRVSGRAAREKITKLKVAKAWKMISG